jgi:hypothetical protein
MKQGIPAPSARPVRRWLVLAFAIAFFTTGAMHWTLAYADVSLPDTLLGAGLVLVVLAAALARWKARASFWVSTLVVGAAVPAAVAARVIVDTASDPTSHNLWPFELVLAGMVGHASAAVGAVIAVPWIRKSPGR